MSYILHWDYNKDNPSVKFSDKFINKIKKAFATAKENGIQVGTWEGDEFTTEPISDTVISFNGIKPNICETFKLDAIRTNKWDCCKVNNKYAILGMEILELAKEEGVVTDWQFDDCQEGLQHKEEWNKLFKRNSK